MHICFENSGLNDNYDFALNQYFVGALKHRQNQDCFCNDFLLVGKEDFFNSATYSVLMVSVAQY